jgi:hypothetical protein
VQATCPQWASRGNSWTAIYYYYVNICTSIQTFNASFLHSLCHASALSGKGVNLQTKHIKMHIYINKQETLRTFNSVETKKYSRMPWNICCTKP